jgi:hypothetical protein
MAAFDLHRRRTRRWWYAGAITAAMLVLFAAAGGWSSIARSASGRSATAQYVTGCTAPTADVLDATSVFGGTSAFEIDHANSTTVHNKTVNTDGANLTLDHSGCTDWLTTALGAGTGVTADRTAGVLVKDDKPTGSGDDSFGQGTSENDAVPTIVSGSIPPNKSDLTHFGIYRESNSSGKFLELFWTRQNAPSGTVDMDFELNKKTCDGTATNCANNAPSNQPASYVTPLRSDGDRLITYDLASGGAVPTISIYTWNAANGDWESGTVISSGGTITEALGSINFTSIASNDSGGLGALDPLTFGEVSLSYKALFPNAATCGKFGSVYLKSRSSNTFTDEMKDFIAPEPVNITNCSTLVTSATNGSVGTGNAIGDTATLSGATNPTGTVTFDLYKFALGTTSFSCTGKPSTAPYVTSLTTNSWTDNGDGTFSASVSWKGSSGTGLSSSDIGLYKWIVSSYTGDAANVVTGLPTGCTDTGEESDVLKVPSTLDTVQKWYPNDTATLGGGGTGNLSFTLYKNDSTCGANGANTTSAVTGLTNISVTPNASGVASTNNGPSGNTQSVAVTAVTANSTDKYYWFVSYAGDSTHKGVTSCVETTWLSLLDNGSQQTSP